MLAFALIFGGLMKRVHQPAVLGEILGGIILGPTVFGAIAPAMQSELFPVSGESAQILRTVTYLGLMAFVFIAGLEVDLTCLKRGSKSTIITSISGIILPFALGFGMVVLMPEIWGIPLEDLRT
jgi:Kef-type K+ transport system membrane component KefB